MTDRPDSQSRTALLYGQAALDRLAASRILLAGLGGVGLYALEALARAGVGSFVLADGDVFEASNLNRQLYALPETLGQSKVQVAAERLKKINPRAAADCRPLFITPENAPDFLRPAPDFVLDATDDVPAKAALCRAAAEAGLPVLTCLGTARRRDPARLRLARLFSTSGCPLGRALRHALKDCPAARGVMAVYSAEEPCPAPPGTPLPSSSVVPAAAGILMASHVINTLIEKP